MATAAARQTGGSVRVTLWILLIVYIFNFIDRQIVNILAEPIRLELGLESSGTSPDMKPVSVVS